MQGVPQCQKGVPSCLFLPAEAAYAAFCECSYVFNQVLRRPEPCGLGTHPLKSLVTDTVEERRRGRRILHAQDVQVQNSASSC